MSGGRVPEIEGRVFLPKADSPLWMVKAGTKHVLASCHPAFIVSLPHSQEPGNRILQLPALLRLSPAAAVNILALTN